MFETVLARTRGASHSKHQIPCEDAGVAVHADGCVVFAVADGHGDSRCPRSALGSKIACDVVLSELAEFHKGIDENQWESRVLSGGAITDALMRQLTSSILAKWVKGVNEDLSENPLTQDERAACSAYLPRYDRGERLEHIYGSTLIAGLLSESYLLLIQQGDGRCVVFDADGNPSQPIPWDDRCFANVTTSLCDEDAVRGFRSCVIDVAHEPIIACFLGTDGVEDSFQTMDLMHSYYRDLLIDACDNGVAELAAHLDESLPSLSERGSGDDITIAGIIDRPLLEPLRQKLVSENEAILLESKIRAIQDRLRSLNGMGRLDALMKKWETAHKELEQAESAKTKAERDYQDFLDRTDFPQNDREADAPESEFEGAMEQGAPFTFDGFSERKRARLRQTLDDAEARYGEVLGNFDRVDADLKSINARKLEYERDLEAYEQTLRDLRGEQAGDAAQPEEPRESEVDSETAELFERG